MANTFTYLYQNLASCMLHIFASGLFLFVLDVSCRCLSRLPIGQTALLRNNYLFGSQIKFCAVGERIMRAQVINFFQLPALETKGSCREGKLWGCLSTQKVSLKTGFLPSCTETPSSKLLVTMRHFLLRFLTCALDIRTLC